MKKKHIGILILFIIICASIFMIIYQNKESKDNTAPAESNEEGGSLSEYDGVSEGMSDKEVNKDNEKYDKDNQEDSFLLEGNKELLQSILVQNNIYIEQENNSLIMSNGFVKIIYNISTGEADIYKGNDEKPTFYGVSAETILEGGAAVKSSELIRDKEDYITAESIEDGFGKGVKVTVKNKSDSITLLQNYFFYEALPYILLEAVITSKDTVKTNYIAPIKAGKGDFKTSVIEIEGNDPRFLFVPFDNDAFVRYNSLPLAAANESYEVTAIFDNVTRNGIIIGSITHDTWKTGIKAKQGGIDAIVDFCIYGGITSLQTRDVLPHGYVSGEAVSSPKIFLGFYEDYRDGMEEYGLANAVIAPPLSWDKGIPMGWNSWSAVADKISYDIYVDSSDFVKEFLQDNSFSEDGVVYINFDSFWDNLTELQLKEAAQHVIDNGQIPGIYTTPFTYWNGGYTAGAVEGTNNRYSWNEVVLKDFNGTMLPAVSGGVSIDPTHPANVMRVKYHLDRFREWGFKYVKMDFMSHGAREGNFYNKEITTGIQAYNYGMSQILEALGEDIDNQEFFISLSIAPLFPSNYAHSRRISCDIFGTIDNAEYMLNSLTYGWWMNGTVYPFNDPDHIVVYNSYNYRPEILFNEGLTRYISSAIAGTMMIDSDDFRIQGARERAAKILTNEEINAVAKKKVSFRPVEGNTKDRACDTFVRHDEDAVYLAVFNFSADKKKNMEVNLSRIGLEAGIDYYMYDLWSKETIEINTEIMLKLDEAEPKLFKITKK